MNRRQSLRTAASFVIAWGLAGAAWSTAAVAADPASRPDPPKVMPTATFVQEAVVSNLFEVESSKLALDRSQNGAVKAFARHMVDDHSAAGVKFTEAMSEAKVTRPPLKLDARRHALLDELADRKGGDFDRIYVEAQHKAHVEAVALFEGYGATGEDAALKAVAVTLLPTLKRHLAEIEKVKAAQK